MPEGRRAAALRYGLLGTRLLALPKQVDGSSCGHGEAGNASVAGGCPLDCVDGPLYAAPVEEKSAFLRKLLEEGPDIFTADRLDISQRTRGRKLVESSHRASPAKRSEDW